MLWSFLFQLAEFLFGSRPVVCFEKEHKTGTSQDTPFDLREAFKSVWQQQGEYAGEKVLMCHEGEALLRTIESLGVTDERAKEIIKFIHVSDQLRPDGWSDQKCLDYIRLSLRSVDNKRWITSGIDLFERHQEDVSKETQKYFHRTLYLKTVLCFALTGLDPDDEQACATG